MFRPRAMMQVEILLLRRDLPATLRALAGAGIIHLYHLGAGGDGQRGFPVEEEERMRRYRRFSARAGGLADELGIELRSGRLLEMPDLDRWEGWLDRLRQRLEALRRRQEQLQGLRLRLLATALFLRRMSGVVGSSYDKLLTLRISSLQLGLVPKNALYEMSGLPDGCHLYTLARIGGQQLVAFLCLRRNEGELARLLDAASFVPIPLLKGVRGDTHQVMMRLGELLRRLRKRTAGLERKVDNLRRSQAEDLRDRLHTARVEMHLLEQERSFRYTRRTVAIGGWVPVRRRKELEAILARCGSGRFQVRRVAASGDHTPVFLANPTAFRPFQKILAAYGTPSYGEIEPTPLLAFAFWILFGMMFGDVGHGLCMVVAGMGLRRWSRWREEGLLIVEVGCFAALFGFLFGSFFGWEGLFEPLWFSPMHDIAYLMGVALAVGVALMTVGMLLGVINGLRHQPPAVVLTDRYGVAGIIFYLGSLLLGYLVYRSLLPPPVLGLLLLPLAAVFLHPFFALEEAEETPAYLLCAEGLVEVIETVLGFLGNTFSFLRVAAFGLAHVGLSLAVFAVAEEASKLSFGIVFAGLAHLVGNVVILVLEGLVVSVQTIRLEFYEFFGKFFRGGGTRFRPLILDPFAERRT